MKAIGYAVLAATAAAALAAPLAALSQAYPTKVVRIIVPHPPGGPGDVPPRGFAQGLSRVLGQAFVVENRDGAEGIIGAEACAKAAPDGHTLCSMSNGVAVLNSVLRLKLPYDSFRDFVPIIETGVIYSVLMAHPSVPANSMQEVIALLRAKPESLTIGTYGSLNFAAMVSRYTKARMGAAFYPIPYKSATQALQSAQAGDVQVVGYALGQAATVIKSGKLKPLVINSDKRVAALPNVPTLKEVGMDMTFRNWFAFFGPAAMPRDIVHRLNTEIAKMIADPAFREKFLASQGLATDWPTGESAEVFAKYMIEERDDFVKLAKIVDIQPQ
jgi:tripartite-type tricarboxylate transporter receptor subunit TctC